MQTCYVLSMHTVINYLGALWYYMWLAIHHPAMPVAKDRTRLRVE